MPTLSASSPAIHAALLWFAVSVALMGQAPEPVPPAPRVAAKCTVILQTRPNRLYCYATNAPFRVILREPARFAHGEVFTAEGELAPEPLVETIPTLLDSTVQRSGEIQLPPPKVLTPAQLATNGLNFHRVSLWGRVVSHEWMKFLDHHLEVIVAQGVDRTFRVNLMEFCDAANRLPPGTEVEFVGLSFVETFAESRGPEAQIDMENLDECRVLKSAPWITPQWARRLPALGGATALLFGLWVARERRQIRRLRAADRTVRELNTGLEQRIAERTAELQAANDRLRQAEQDLLRTLATEKELNLLKTRFVSMVSHELRNPLGIVMCSAEVLKHYLEDLPEAERESHLDAIQEASRRMSNLME